LGLIHSFNFQTPPGPEGSNGRKFLKEMLSGNLTGEVKNILDSESIYEDKIGMA